MIVTNSVAAMILPLVNVVKSVMRLVALEYAIDFVINSLRRRSSGFG